MEVIIDKKLYLISLGCNKNLVDSEVMLGKLKDYKIVDDPSSADVLIVNTCGFISSAKEESLNTILELHKSRKKGSKLVVSGCLTERYREELALELPEVDLFCGVGDYAEINKIIDTNKSMFTSGTFLIDDEERIISNSTHHAFIKISEGCNQSCSFCAIPSFKGKLKSREISSIVKEITKLVAQGFYDFTFLSQDSSSYLKDKGVKKDGLIKLIDAVENINGVKLARLLYLYPSSMTTDLIDKIANSKIFLNYFDIPLQHISNNMLKIMKRGFDREKTLNLLNYITKLDDIFLRSSFIVGHPGESDEDFNELIEFIKSYPIDRITIFAYSQEDNTVSHDMEQVNPDIINDRLNIVEKIVKDKIETNLKNDLNSKVDVIVEGYGEHEYLLSAKKSIWDREIDGEIIINDKQIEKVEFGKIYTAEITDLIDGRLIAKILK